MSSDDYKAELVRLSTAADTAQAAVGKALSAKTIAEVEAGVSAFADDEARIGDDVAKVKPPKDAEAANAKLAKGLHDLADEIRAVLPDLKKQTSAQAAVAFLDKNLNGAAGARDVDAALSELKSLGYSTGS